MSAAQTEIAALAREFALGEIADSITEDDRYPDAPFDETLYRKAGEVGFLSLLMPEEAGGAGETPSALAEALLTLAETDASAAAVVLCQAFAHRILIRAGKGNLASAEALTATTLYDDPLDLPEGLSASRKGDSYILDGTIDYVTLAPVASFFILPAVLEDEPAIFLLEKGDGVEVGEPVLTLGLRACPVADIELDQARGTLLASGGDALSGYREAVEDLRCGVAAIHAGIVAGCLAEAVAYARDRYQGWKQIIDHGQIRAYLGSIAAAAAVSKELALSAAEHASDHANAFPASVQLTVGEMAVESTINGVQVLGGNGYMEDYGQAKRMRDAKQAQGIFGPKDLLVQDIFLTVAEK
jgi:alkylation response protein AidB-like acyl-CoA dehydrogenase